MSTYIDTSAFYALVDTTDSNHQAAVSTWQSLLQQGDMLITSIYVVTETVALLHNRFGTNVVRRLVDDNLPAVQIHWVDQQMHSTALAAMLATPGRRGPSLTDCASLEVMRQLKLDNIFAYDLHFAELGLTVVG